MNARERFWAKVDKRDPGECWEWRGGVIGRGYGEFHVKGPHRTAYAHRFSYELAHGPIPDGMTIDHLCRNRLCVNPDHLEVVTNQENILRGTSWAAVNARKTHCLRGHLLPTTRSRQGRRVCTECFRLNLYPSRTRATA